MPAGTTQGCGPCEEARVVCAHAAQRLVSVIAAGLASVEDPRTMAGLSRVAGMSIGAVRMRCATAGISPRRVLDFTRVLRAVVLANSGGWNAADTLDIVDRRSLNRLLARGRIDPESLRRGMSVADYVHEQGFIHAPTVLAEVGRYLGTK